VLCDGCHSRHHGKLALVERPINRQPVQAPLVPANSIQWLMKGA
jgi:hypothetical protein